MVNIDVMLKKTHTYLDQKSGESFELPYRVYYPTGYSTEDDKTYPILFFLHGHGECGTDNRLQIRVLEKEHRLLNLVMERDDCIIVAPQCPCNPKYEWVPLNHAWATGSRELTEEPTVGLAAAIELLMTFLDSGKVDRKRVYSAGISMGGYGTWELITRHSELFAASIPVCGSGIPSLAHRLTDIAIWAFHGAKDDTVPAQGSRDMVEAITKAGGTKIRYTEFPGVYHDSWIPAYKTEGLVDWLFAQHK
ncbi:MAG: dienelactone hydrolase family protein [Clostridia bacterium]|nr:dienelactone hydrolase family protein [Clostridia bacterium]